MVKRKQIISEKQLAINFNAGRRTNRLALFNWLLAALVLAALLGYLVLSNQLTAQRYGLAVRRGQLNEAAAALELLNAAHEQAYALEQLMAFAQARGLVETKTSDALFQQAGVALTNVAR